MSDYHSELWNQITVAILLTIYIICVIYGCAVASANARIIRLEENSRAS